MNRKAILLPIFLFLLFSQRTHAQQDSLPANRLAGYAGIQVNQLIKQIINLDAQDEIIDNPYLLQAGLFLDGKWGIQVGGGYQFESSSDKYAPGKLETEFHDVNYRVGIARNIPIGSKFQLITGLDFVGNYVLNRTQSATVVETFNTYDSTMNFTREEITGYGGGLQLRFMWMPAKRFSIGTETTFYYIASDAKEHVMVSQVTEFNSSPFNNNYQLASENSHVKSAEFRFTLPVAIFLSIHF